MSKLKPLSKAAVRVAVDLAYTALERAVESSTDATRLLRDALEAATAGEKAHRRMGAGLGTYRVSVETAARYFVCKWFATPHRVKSALDACMLRADCLNASALREWCDREGKRVDVLSIAMIDYSGDIAGDS